MAEGLLRHEGGAPFEVHSAGTHPTSVRPEAIAVMSELGIDISRHWSKSVDEFAGTANSTSSSRSATTQTPRAPTFRETRGACIWPFEDPAAVTGTPAEKLAAFRQARDQIQAKVREFIKTNWPQMNAD